MIAIHHCMRQPGFQELPPKKDGLATSCTATDVAVNDLSCTGSFTPFDSSLNVTSNVFHQSIKSTSVMALEDYELKAEDS
jgi:hypothetical protein